MAAITKPEADKAGAFMREFWPYVKKYFTPEEPEEYWAALMDDGNALGAKYDSSSFATKMIVSFMEYLNDKWKAGRESNNEPT